MLTLFTAVGHLTMQKTEYGRRLPIVRVNKKEYDVAPRELILWSGLAFQILTYPELEQVVERNCADSGQSISLPLSHYLNRLLLRGLLVKGMGVSAVDALYRLLGTLTITPVEDRFLPRLASVFLLYTKGQVRLKDIPRLLRKTKCTPTEREVLALAGKAPLSTAELLLSMERGILIRKDHELAEKESINVEDIKQYSLIMPGRENAKNQILHWMRCEESALNIPAYYNILSNAALLVEAGMGCAVCLDGALSIHADPEICFRKIFPTQVTRSVILWKKNHLFSHAASLFLQTIQEH